jgi:hypothetical protein
MSLREEVMAPQREPGPFTLRATFVLVAARNAARSVLARPPKRGKAALLEACSDMSDAHHRPGFAAAKDQAEFEDTNPGVWSPRLDLPDLRP